MLEDPGLRLWAQRAFAQEGLACATARDPLPELVSLSELDDRLVSAFARTADDLPRSLLERTTELAAMLESLPLFEESNNASSAAAAARLATEWAELFQRWDWLICGYRAAQQRGLDASQGPPSPEAGQLPDDLEPLGPIYVAAHDPADLAYWFAERQSSGGLLPPSPRVRLLSLGAPSSPLMAAGLVLGWAGQALTSIPALPEDPLWLDLFPELRSLQEPQRGAPDPSAWTPIAQRSVRLQSGSIGPRVRAHLSWEPANSLEDLALQSSARLRTWATDWREGEPPIGLVVTDRLALRRLVALLGAGCAVDDPSGWVLSTTVAGAALEGVLHLRSGGMSSVDLLSWASNPFVQQAWTDWCAVDTAIQSADDTWAELGRQLYDALARGGEWRRAAKDSPLLSAFSHWLRILEGPSRRPSRGLDGWTDDLLQALEASCLGPAIAADEAGERVLQVLTLAHSEWRSGSDELPGEVPSADSHPALPALLRLRLEAARLPRRQPAAPVRVCSVEEALALGCRRVLVLGASDQAFPPVRIGRLASADEDALIRCDVPPWQEQALFAARLLRLAERAEHILFTARASGRGEEVVRSSLVERLDLLLGLEQLTPGPLRPPLVTLSDPPRLRSLTGPFECPESLSVRDAAILLDCPYRFVWSVVLGLSPLSLPEEGLSAAARGSFLHALAHAHAKAVLRGAASRDATVFNSLLESLLKSEATLSGPDRVLVRAAARSYWRWHAAEAAGVLLESEKPLEIQLPQTGIRLTGRIDQLRQAPSGACVLVDLKSASPSSLKSQVEVPSVAGQLQLYAAMLSSPAAGPRPIDRAVLVSLTATESAEGQEVDVSLDPEVLGRLESALLRLRTSPEVDTPAATRSPDQSCRRCPAFQACPSRPEVSAS